MCARTQPPRCCVAFARHRDVCLCHLHGGTRMNQRHLERHSRHVTYARHETPGTRLSTSSELRSRQDSVQPAAGESLECSQHC